MGYSQFHQNLPRPLLALLDRLEQIGKMCKMLEMAGVGLGGCEEVAKTNLMKVAAVLDPQMEAGLAARVNVAVVVHNIPPHRPIEIEARDCALVRMSPCKMEVPQMEMLELLKSKSPLHH